MKRILFIILPSPSHYHASFSFAKKLKSEGMQISYVGTPHLEETVTKEGFHFMHWHYTSEYVIKTLKAFLGVFLKSISDKSLLETRKVDYWQNITDVRKLIIESGAEQIYLDEHLSEYYIYFNDLKVQTRILCTKISSRKSKGIPPMDSYYIPSNSWISNIYCEVLWKLKNLRDQRKKLIHRLAFIGQDENSFLKEYCKDNKIDLKSTLDYKNYFYPSIIGLERVILGNKIFDYPWRKVLPTESYELYEITRNEQKYMSPAYLDLLEEWSKQANNNKHLLYFSFGTVTYKDENRVQILLDKIIAIVKKREDLVLVISKSNYQHDSIIHPRIHSFHYVPQLHLLTFCDLMITHGGHNSIKECIQKSVKMLVFPHMENNDQPGNAARVEFGGQGLMGKLTKDSVSTISTKIEKLLSIYRIAKPKKEANEDGLETLKNPHLQCI
ncbi:UDP:flavonoid glycosyltransferase YjiC, YdhE family [Spirosomataceae bacterium TFI 002]|nr:UDP:flavonoid glycosyltransferase YjiC, YdhE family [Spirosomataceae bacterium TFI 002]